MGLGRIVQQGNTMTREPMTRLGCDGCKKVDLPTHGFRHWDDPLRIWLCQACLNRMLRWPTRTKRTG